MSSGARRGGENTLRRLAHFLHLDHPTKSDLTSGKKGPSAGNFLECGICVLSVSKMAIFCNRLQI